MKVIGSRLAWTINFITWILWIVNSYIKVFFIFFFSTKNVRYRKRKRENIIEQTCTLVHAWCWKNNLCFTCCSWIRLSSIFLLLIYCFFVLLSCLRLSSDSCVPLLDWWYKLGSTQLLLASSLEGLSDFVVDFY